ncbi:MAG: hypothetical protein OEQ53_21535, partial [Saprospiraceae bacterium]|nr:hypothetical protein [Saprospiraceae bacterium]
KNNQLFFVLVILLSYSSIVFAQNKSWDGGALTKNWHDANNWSPNGVPINTDYVRIQFDSVHLGSSASVRNLKVIDAQLTIDTSVALTIDADLVEPIPGLIVDDKASIYNYGTLSILNTIEEGMTILDSSRVFMSAPGMIFISECGADGVSLARGSSLIVDSAGLLFINGTGGNGLLNDSSRVINRVDAVMVVGATAADGIRNRGLWSNRGQMIIAEVGNYGFRTEDSLFIGTKGTIRVDSAAIGLFTNGRIENFGQIIIKRSHENGSGVQCNTANNRPTFFNNYGELNIDSVDNEGIAMVSPQGFVINHLDGSIKITNLLKSFSEGILLSHGLIDNQGKIEIDDAKMYGIYLNGGKLTNSDSISIRNIENLGLYQESDSLVNQPSGFIRIENCSIPAEIDSSSLFDCQGSIEIDK